MHTDALLYRVFQERPRLLFELAGLPWPAAADEYHFRLCAIEVKQTAFRLDGVLLPAATADAKAPVLFVENQFQAVANFYGRWLAAIFLYLYRHRVQRPWCAIAVFPQRQTEPLLGPAFSALAPAGLLRRVYLEDLLELPAPGLGLRLLRLIVLAAEDTAGEARALATAARAEADPLALIDLIETILVYKLPKLTREEIKQMLHLPDTELKQTRFYQDVFAEGREEGREEGRILGRQEAARQLARKLLQETSLDPATIASVTGLSASEVETLRAG